ncbi:MAG: CDC48 family AAA ATPase [Bacillota bacterium]|nr:CDC48 family AAA ATPase [Bacillota bacterium]
MPKDAGRGIARFDPADMAAIGASVGDVVEIRGKRATVARVMPAHPEYRGKSVVQADGLIRQNAQAGIDDRVQVELTTARSAQAIIVAPVGQVLLRGDDSGYVAKFLEGLPVMVGDLVRARLFASGFQDLVILQTTPAGPVLLGLETKVEIRTKAEEVSHRPGSFSYEDVGGLGKEVQRLREMIESPLRYPEVFRRLGIEPPRGVLLHGPPGCGKTLIARAIANETSARFFSINGPEIIHKFYGESEAHLRQIFDQAQKHAPSVLFIDEIDAVAPKRAEVTGEVEKRVVAQLLALMDGLKARGQVVVIGATNIPDVLDPALRRPGRFDREIFIGIPDSRGRLEILEIHTRGMPLAADVDLRRLAEATHGFVGADLQALCRESAMTALRRFVPKIDLSSGSIPYEDLLTLEVTMEDFLEALQPLEPSALREVFAEIPAVSWEDIGGLSAVKKTLQESVEWPLHYRAHFEALGCRAPKGILLYGLPGTGKTMLAKAVATESGLNFISVKGPELLSKYVGESEKAIREVFRKARQASPCILFFDEIESLVPSRRGGTDSGVADRVVSQFLTELDGIESLRDVVVLAATNRLDLMDPALLRPGRFDLRVEVTVPDAATRRAIFAVHLHGKPLAADVDIATLAELSDGWSGAEIEAAVRAAAVSAIRESLTAGTPVGELRIAWRHFRESLAEAKT